jgi:hypothetical protein
MRTNTHASRQSLNERNNLSAEIASRRQWRDTSVSYPMIHSSDHPTKISYQSKLQRIGDSSIQLPRGQVALSRGDALNLSPTQLNDPNRNGCNAPFGLTALTPSDLQSRPSRPDGEPNGLLPTQRPALVAPPNRRVPIRNRLRAIANNHVSRHTQARVPLVLRLERPAESWPLPPLGLDQLLSLLA